MALERLKRTILRVSPPPVAAALISGWRWMKRKRVALQPAVRQADLEAALRAAGCGAGDTLLVHSSLSALGKVEGGPETVIRALDAVVGPGGTLVLPTFSIPGSMYERLKDPEYVFDPETTPSNMGAITETFRRLPGVRRSVHPTHSIAVRGRHQARILDPQDLTYPTNLGPGTPMGRLTDLGAKVVGIGISMAPLTYYHCFEDHVLDRFPGMYLPERMPVRVRTPDGVLSTSVLAHDPAYHATRIDKDPRIEASIKHHFDVRGIRRVAPVGKTHLFVIPCADMWRALDELQRQGVTIYTG